jgi:hypothetical protein
MPVAVNDVETLRQYISGVMGRVDHHAGNVGAAVLALAGAIIWRKDPEPIEVHQRDGELKNVLWVKVNHQRYAFSYNHSTQEVEMRQNSVHGNAIHTFSNATTITDIETVFRNL